MRVRACVLVVCLLMCATIFGGSSLVREENFMSIEFCYKGQIWKWSDDVLKDVNVFTHQEKAQRNGRQGNFMVRSNLVERVHNLGFSYEDSFDYTFFGLREIVDKMCKGINKEMKDATLNFNANKSPYFFITDEQTGTLVDKEQLYFKLLQAIKQKPRVRIDVETTELLPKVTKQDLQKKTTLKAKFETYYGSSSANRKNNVELAIKKFNGMILNPNQQYSFNKITGRRTAQNGYKEANIIVQNEYTKALGGGVCQVSTTLYNALLLSGMEIIEANPHSLASSYVMTGFDAMVNFGSSDLKWKNNTQDLVYLRTYANGEIIGVEVYGIKEDISVKRFSQVVRTINPPSDKIIKDENMFEDEIFYKTYPKNGSEVKSYLEFYKNGQFISKKLIRKQTYKSVQGVKVVGTKVRPKPEISDSLFDSLFENQFF